MDTITNMKAFVAVAECGSFVGAARRLKVAASIVTKRVEQLEWRVGHRLLERSTRRVALTEAGTRLLPDAQRIAQDLDDTLLRMRETEPLAGLLRVKVPTHFTAFCLADQLARFERLHPQLTMKVVALDRAVDPVLEGFDVAIGMFAASFEGVDEIVLCRLQRMLVASPDYMERHAPLLHPTDLVRHKILNFQPLGTTWTFHGASGPIAVDVQPRLQSNDGQVLMQAALHGNGVTLLTSYLLEPAVRAGALVPLLPDHGVDDLWVRAQVPQARRHAPGVMELIEFLQDAFSSGEIVPAMPVGGARVDIESITPG